MPNWNENHVEITGSNEEVKRFIELMTDKFDYNRIIPMPEELDGYSCPVQIISQEEYEQQEEEYKKWLKMPDDKKEPRFFTRGMTQEMSDHFKKEYGYDNWYDWAIANWGVKWNTSPDSVTFDSGDTWGRWEFLSPWGPPELVCKKLRELFPNVEITWFYQEPGMQISGWL